MSKWQKWGKATHHGHTVAWQGVSHQMYRLYCYDCGRFTGEDTPTPNTLQMQKYEQAFASPFTTKVAA
jgi:hypothetical protein